MKKTNADRQRRYREKVLKDPDGPRLTRLQTMISADTGVNLERICSTTGQTKRSVIEQAINGLADTLKWVDHISEQLNKDSK